MKQSTNMLWNALGNLRHSLDHQSPVDGKVPDEWVWEWVWKEADWKFMAACLFVCFVLYFYGRAEGKKKLRRWTPKRPLSSKGTPFPPQSFTSVTSLSRIPSRTPLPLPITKGYPSVFPPPFLQCSPITRYVPESASYDLSSFPRIPIFPESSWLSDPEHKGISIISYDELKPCLRESLGKGAFGNVIALSGKFTGYCMKVFKYGWRHYQECLEEARLMQRLAHLKIPELKGICLEPPGIIMSCHQITLLSWIIDERPTPMEALDALIQLCHIIKELHREGFCHNDIKVNNVMIDRDGNGIHVILIDFGITSKIGTRTFYFGRSLNFGEQVACLKSSNYKSFYAPKLYIGDECSPSTDAFALAYLIRWVLRFVNIRGHRLQTLLGQYSRSFGDGCSVDALLKEMKLIWDDAHEKAPDIARN